MPLLENVAVFESYRGENFSGNPKYIMKELAARAPHFKCIFAVQQPVSADYGPNCQQVRRMGVRYYYFLARAKYTVSASTEPGASGEIRVTAVRNSQLYPISDTDGGGSPLRSRTLA